MYLFHRSIGQATILSISNALKIHGYFLNKVGLLVSLSLRSCVLCSQHHIFGSRRVDLLVSHCGERQHGEMDGCTVVVVDVNKGSAHVGLCIWPSYASRLTKCAMCVCVYVSRQPGKGNQNFDSRCSSLCCSVSLFLTGYYTYQPTNQPTTLTPQRALQTPFSLASKMRRHTLHQTI
jgi:hypothetical protein